MNATSLIYGSLRLCREGLVRAGRTASPEQLADGLARLNDMIDAWGVEQRTVYVLLRTVKTLASSTASYTIGTGGSINIVRPTEIQQAGLILDLNATPKTEVALAILSDQDWQAIAQKDLASPLARAIYFDHGWTAGLGNVYVWPVPNVGTTQLVLYTPQALTAFADQSTNYTFPPGYAEALRYQLALRMAPEFGGLKDPDGTTRLAIKALAIVKRANSRAVVLRCDPSTPGMGAGRGFNIYTGESK